MGMSSLDKHREQIDIIIILGSSCSVHDQNEWQQI